MLQSMNILTVLLGWLIFWKRSSILASCRNWCPADPRQVLCSLNKSRYCSLGSIRSAEALQGYKLISTALVDVNTLNIILITWNGLNIIRMVR